LYILDVVENETIYGLKEDMVQKCYYDLKGVALGYALLHEYSD